MQHCSSIKNRMEIKKNLKKVWQHLRHQNGLSSNHTLLNAFCSFKSLQIKPIKASALVEQFLTLQRTFLTLQVAYWNHHTAKSPKTLGTDSLGEKKPPGTEGNDAQLRIHRTTVTEDGQCWTLNPRIITAIPVSTILLYSISSELKFPCSPKSLPLSSWSRAMNVLRTDLRGPQSSRRQRLAIPALD